MSILSVVKDIQQSVPVPRWKVSSGKVGTGVFVSSTTTNEWTFDDYKKIQTWVVFGTGEGYVYFELAKRLIDAGHSPETVFTSGMLVGYDIDIGCIQVLKEKVFNLFGIDKSQITVYNKNYFELEKTVDFDNFIINSPYLDGTKGNAFVSHLHTQAALDHWNRKGKGVSITKSSTFLGQKGGVKTFREQIFNPVDNAVKVRNLPDDAFPNAIVRAMYVVWDPNSKQDYLEFVNKDGISIYTMPNDTVDNIFPSLIIKEVLEKIGTNSNDKSHYATRRTDNNVECTEEVDTITMLSKGQATITKTNSEYYAFGNYGVVMTFMTHGDVTDPYRSHTHNACMVTPTQSVKSDYIVIDCGSDEKEAISVLTQIKHPLNAWVHAFTRTSEQAARTPQFRFCCRLSVEEFYNLWPDGNPTVQEYFDYWNIPTKHQTEILDWYSKYV